MKRLHSPDVRGEDSGDPDRGIPDALQDEGSLDSGLEPGVETDTDTDADAMPRSPRAQGEATRSPDPMTKGPQ